MKLARLEISDTYGCKELILEPGSVTWIRGRNGSGKTSIINALMTVFDGGSDPGIIRNGAKRSVVRLTLDNGVRIEKVTTASGSRLEITDANGLVVPTPAKFIAQLAESMALNPGRLLKIDASTKPGKKALMEALLETMPVEFSLDDIEAVAPLTDTKPPRIQPTAQAALVKIGQTWPPSKVDLDAIDKYRRTMEESRRKVGQERDECQKGADALAKSVPAVEDGDAARARAIEIDCELGKLGAAEQVETVSAVEEFAHQERELREKFNRELAEIQGAKHKRTGEIALAYAQQTDPLRAEKATVAEQVRAADKAAGAREQIEKLRDRYRIHATEYDLFTACLKLLADAKAAKLEHLPIEGLTFADGDVFIDGVRWQDCNKARLTEISIQHAALRPGELNLVLEDDAEHLDSDTTQALTEALTGAGFQVIFAHMTSGIPLSIETKG